MSRPFCVQIFVFVFLSVLIHSNAEDHRTSALEWSQWLGPNRDGISPEANLLTEWGVNRPQVLWRSPIGDGFSGISIAKGRGYTMDATDGKEFIYCFDILEGKEIWRFQSDEVYLDSMGGHGPRSTPTVEENMLFTMSAHGKIYALDTKNGKEIWSHDLKRKFGGKTPRWGFSTSPLIEENLVLVEVGGRSHASLVAFDKHSGNIIWESDDSKIGGYSSPIAVTSYDIRQAIFFTGNYLVSVAPTSGKIYWKHPWKTSFDVNASTPIFIPSDKLFISSGYGVGATILQMKLNNESIAVEEVWRSKVMKNQFGTAVLNGDYLFGFDDRILVCINANTGKEMWKQRGYGQGTLILADNHLIILSDKGKLALAEVSSSGFKEKAGMQVLNGTCWTVPTLSGGKLYLRSMSEIVCLKVTNGP